MENNTLVIIAVVAIIASVVGAFIGYLLGGKQDSGLEAQKAAAEARSLELEKQLAQKNTEISKRDDELSRLQDRSSGVESEKAGAEAKAAELEKQIGQQNVEKLKLDEQIKLQQDRLLESESAKSKAQTELREANENIRMLHEELESGKAEITSLSEANSSLKETNATLAAKHEASLKAIQEQKQFLTDANDKLREAFESLSSEALRKNNSFFLEAAKETLDAKVKESANELENRKVAIETLVKPLGESLKNFDGKLSEIELKRVEAYSEMKTLMDAMKNTTESLNSGTNQLVSALKTSHVRGKYGEISLRRVVEVAGLSPYCDFDEQVSVQAEGGKLRPDMNINLPGSRQLILDAKVPLAAYMRAFETDDEAQRNTCIKEHALAVRKHLKELSNKSYWDQFEQAPDFVIMYLQIESSFGAALMSDPALIEDAIEHKIVMATPSTLITMLRTVGFMWQQERMAESIYDMRDAGIQLYNRTNKMLEHFVKIGSGLTTAVNSYNSAVGSMETRVITQLEKIKEIGGTLIREDLAKVKHIDITTREVVKKLPIIEPDLEVYPVVPPID